MNYIEHDNISLPLHQFDDKDGYLYVVSEHSTPGCLTNIMKKLFPDGIKDEVLVATIVKEVLQGVQYLHQNNIIHRNLTGDSVIVTEKGEVRICNFDLAMKHKEGEQLTEFCGTPSFMAPELFKIKKNKGYDEKVDIWSLGMLVMMLVSGKPLFDGLTALEVASIPLILNWSCRILISLF